MNNVKTAVLLALMTALLMIIGQLVGGKTGLITMFVVSMGMNFFGYWNSAPPSLEEFTGVAAITQPGASS